MIDTETHSNILTCRQLCPCTEINDCVQEFGRYSAVNEEDSKPTFVFHVILLHYENNKVSDTRMPLIRKISFYYVSKLRNPLSFQDFGNIKIRQNSTDEI